MPTDWRRTVQSGFARYAWWNALHVASGTVTGTLATQALLEALQFNALASAGMAATANWIIKDGFGLLGGIAFATLVSARFDGEPKRYRWAAGLLLQATTLLEIATPVLAALWTPSFLILASLSNIGKNVAWLAVSATKASIHRSFTRADNLGDVTAKVAAQGVAASFGGTAVGIALNYVYHMTPSAIFALWLPCSAFHLYCLYRSSVPVASRTLNRHRFELACRPLIDAALCGGSLETAVAQLQSPSAVAKLEKFVRFTEPPSQWPGLPVKVQPSLRAYDTDALYPALEKLPSDRFAVLRAKDHVALWFSPSATAADQLEGFMFASLVRADLPETVLAALARAGWLERLEKLGWDLSTVHLVSADRRLLVSAKGLGEGSPGDASTNVPSS